MAPPPGLHCSWEAVVPNGWGNHVHCVDDSEYASLRRGAFSLTDNKRCSWAEAWSCSTQRSRQVVFGPFWGHVMEWHTLIANLPWFFRAGDRITGFTADAVALNGVTPIGYPPLHLHHIHLEREVPHWWETHGDYAQDEALGYHHDLPPGACVVQRATRGFEPCGRVCVC